MIWLGLFLIILAASFILAYLSMKNYQEIPPPLENGLYLIRNPAAITEALLDKLHEKLSASGLLVSLERLYKGEKKAWVIYGPVKILPRLTQLNLLELEDYTNVPVPGVNSFEMELRPELNLPLPILSENEQFWLQIILQPAGKKSFQTTFRALVLSKEQKQKGIGELSFSPRPLSSEKIFSLYKNRVATPGYSSSKIGVSFLFKLLEKL